MRYKRIDIDEKQIVLHTDGAVCQSTRELSSSSILRKIVSMYLKELKAHDSPIIDRIHVNPDNEEQFSLFIAVLQALGDVPAEKIPEMIPSGGIFLTDLKDLHIFIEGLYDYWRGFDRYLITHSMDSDTSHDRKPYRTFNNTIEKLTHVVRALYRDICENITGDHPRIYRQVAAAFDVGIITTVKKSGVPELYSKFFEDMPFIRQVMINPPMIIDPPMNKRTGQFQEVTENPATSLKLEKGKWLCYPAQVGPVVVFICFHQSFIGLGCSLANLFELASEEQIESGPDAIYFFGADPERMKKYGDLPTVFYDDTENNLLVAAAPNEPRFGYFGYLKKMVLTLHNIAMMKRELMPFHGAMTRISLKGGASANILIIGDTGAGKSESLEALRTISKDRIREMIIIADDMGSLEIKDGKIIGYGTEIGAFIRLDDLQQGYAYAQIDRAIIMSPQKINARVVLPVTTMDEVLRGYPVDMILYANNYEDVNDKLPSIERFSSPEDALKVFSEGIAMSKGTTTSTGLGKSYFANIFGPPQRKDMHDRLAEKTFHAAFSAGVFIGQLRTRLGIPGYEMKGPEEAALALLDFIRKTGKPK